MDKLYKESKISIFGNYSTSSSSTNSKDNYFYDDDDFDEDTDSMSILDVYKTHGSEHDNIEWVANKEAYCFDVPKFAEKLVNVTFLEARKNLQTKSTKTVADIVKPLLNDLVSCVVPTDISLSSSIPPLKSVPSSRVSSQSIDWPKISEFNIKLGLEKLEDYVATWNRSSDWLYCVEFLGFESEECSNIFVYEVEWSKPTNAYPIPQVTASVYFALEVLKMVPYNHDRSIEVTYVFETSNVIHSPDTTVFQEKWLDAIINSKLKILKRFVFSVFFWFHKNYKLKLELKYLLLSINYNKIKNKY
ncbi:hypothetical protein RUM44_010814 [Polyplax serrata]|uniref:A-kinase anchor protein 14 n=1 Tax=Polyplax serrata TaxID=468196 RepID=A0ABR1AN92_POLSC